MINEIFKEHKPDIVYHAAASKHVDLVENNWFYGSMNNIRSTYNICESSIMNNVKKLSLYLQIKLLSQLIF